MPSKRARPGPVKQAEAKPVTEAKEATLKCTMCTKLIDKMDDYRLLDCGVCKRDDIYVHEICIATYLKKEGRGQAQKTGFKCPTILDNGKPCKGYISKSHPFVAANEKKKELARLAASNPPKPQPKLCAPTTSKGSTSKAVKNAMTNTGRQLPPVPLAQPTTTFVLGDFLTQPVCAPPPSAPTPASTVATGNVWLERNRAAHAERLAAAHEHQAQQVVGKQELQAHLLLQLGQGNNQAEEVASMASGIDDFTCSSVCGSTTSGGGHSNPGTTISMPQGSLSPVLSLLGSTVLGSALPSPNMEKQVAQLLFNEEAFPISMDEVGSVTTSHTTSLLFSGQLAWLAPAAAELKEVMQAAAGGGQVLFCTLVAGSDSNSLDRSDPIVAVQPVFELSLTPVGLPGCGAGHLTQTIGVKVVRDPSSMACHNPEDFFGSDYRLVSFKVLLPVASEGRTGEVALPLVAEGVPIRRSQILAASGVSSEEVVVAATPVTHSTQSFQSESEDDLALELAHLCGCNC